MRSWTFSRRKVMELYKEEQYILCKEIIFPANGVKWAPPLFVYGPEKWYRIKLELMSTTKA
jgi:hypothetical protein